MTPREEIEKKLSNLERVREVAYGDFKRIREILATHELVPIDNTPFDPERCGFTKDSQHAWDIIYRNSRGDSFARQGNLLVMWADDKVEEGNESAGRFTVDWPNHSDGVRLLQLLGLEVRTSRA